MLLEKEDVSSQTGGPLGKLIIKVINNVVLCNHAIIYWWEVSKHYNQLSAELSLPTITQYTMHPCWTSKFFHSLILRNFYRSDLCLQTPSDCWGSGLCPSVHTKNTYELMYYFALSFNELILTCVRNTQSWVWLCVVALLSCMLQTFQWTFSFSKWFLLQPIFSDFRLSNISYNIQFLKMFGVLRHLAVT